MSPPVDVLIHVQHLLGIGHLMRAATLARAMSRRGLALVFVSGGLPVAGLDVGQARFVQLPPLQAGDAAFSFLADAEGRRVGGEVMAARRDQLLSLLEASRPKAILTEMFPFGRRALRIELLAMIEAARRQAQTPRIVSSVRDILNHPISAGKTDWIVETANRWYDLVLVHGDPDFISLERTFPRLKDLTCRIAYTGYVAPEPLAEPPGACGPGREVLVSAGGGAVGLPLLNTAIRARPLTRLADQPWRILVGPSLSERDLRSLAENAPDGVIVERPRRDFRSLLGRARLSISQGGYNTLIEVLQAGVPAVVVPFAEAGENEQTERAMALAERGLVTLTEAHGLTPVRLAQAVDRASPAGAPGDSKARDLDTAGAERSAEIMARLIQEVTS